MAVSFDEERTYAPVGAPSQATGLIGLMQKWGLAKDAKEASRGLLIIAGILVLIAVAVFIFAMPEKSEPIPVDTSKLRPR